MAASDAKTIYRIASRTLPYSQLGNAMIRDKRLSYGARFALCYILTCPPNWTFRLTWLQGELDVGRDKAYRWIGELVKHGYCKRDQTRRSNGKMGTTSYSFSDDPDFIAEPSPLPENQEAVIPHLASPLPDLPYPVNPQPTNKHQSKKHIGDRIDAHALTDGPTGRALPFTVQVITEITKLGCDPNALIARYQTRTKGKRISDPSAYLLGMARDEVAKRAGITAEQLKQSTSKDRGLRIAANAVATGAFSTPSAAALARASRCEHVAAILQILAKRRFATQAECDRAFQDEVTNARFRPPGQTVLRKVAI